MYNRKRKKQQLLPIFLFFVVIILGCQSAKVAEQQQQQHKDALNEIFAMLANNSLQGEGYSGSDRNFVHVKLNKISSNYVQEPILTEYLMSYISERVENNFIYTLKLTASGYDIVWDLNLIKTKSNKIKILVNVLDAATKKIFFTEQSVYNLNDFDLNNYEKFKETFPKRKKRKKEKEIAAHVTFEAKFIADVYKEKDVYYLNTKYNVFGNIVDQWISKYDTGYSGYYPAEMKIYINGRAYERNTGNILFDGKISPGRIDCIASFRGAMWDNIERQQTIVTPEYSKRFVVNVKEKDRLKVDVLYGYNGKQKKILVKVSRIKKIYQKGTVQERYEIIEIF